jgi:serine protease AprX
MPTSRTRTAVLFVTAITLMVSAGAPAAHSADVTSTKVSPAVLRATSGDATATFLALLSARADLSGARTLPTKLAKDEFVFQTLRSFADRTQAPITSMLRRMGAPYRSHYLVNLLWVKGDRAVVDALAARTDVAQILPNPSIRSSILPQRPAILAPAAPGTPATIEWNVSRVNAPRVWSHGDTGQGIVLGIIDTGQQWDHPALESHYRGWDGATVDHNYNWYDATSPSSPVPIDPYGHGTHTTGTMIGDDGGVNQIGVAPGAQWMSCRSMDASGAGTPDTYITCFEFMIAPWDLNGQNPDPSKAPVAVSNSWYCSISLEGCSQGVLLQTVQNVRAAGIVPVVAAGNAGPSCSTIGIDGPPAQYDESFTVGATTRTNTLATFSSRGPASFQGQRVKPDISAPGDGVRSAYPPNTYAVLSGTSMATPHIAGVIALIYAMKPQLIGDVSGTEALIDSTAHHVNSSACSSNGTYPNNLYGYGLVDAAAAVRAPASDRPWLMR